MDSVDTAVPAGRLRGISTSGSSHRSPSSNNTNGNTHNQAHKSFMTPQPSNIHSKSLSQWYSHQNHSQPNNNSNEQGFLPTFDEKFSQYWQQVHQQQQYTPQQQQFPQHHSTQSPKKLAVYGSVTQEFSHSLSYNSHRARLNSIKHRDASKHAGPSAGSNLTGAGPASALDKSTSSDMQSTSQMLSTSTICMKNKFIPNRKQRQLDFERQSEIERQNVILLNKISRIMLNSNSNMNANNKSITNSIGHSQMITNVGLSGKDSGLFGVNNRQANSINNNNSGGSSLHSITPKQASSVDYRSRNHSLQPQQYHPNLLLSPSSAQQQGSQRFVKDDQTQLLFSSPSRQSHMSKSSMGFRSSGSEVGTPSKSFQVISSGGSGPKSLNVEKRYQNLLRIASENQDLLHRIKAKKSDFSTQKFAQISFDQQRHLVNSSKFRRTRSSLSSRNSNVNYSIPIVQPTLHFESTNRNEGASQQQHHLFPMGIPVIPSMNSPANNKGEIESLNAQHHSAGGDKNAHDSMNLISDELEQKQFRRFANSHFTSYKQNFIPSVNRIARAQGYFHNYEPRMLPHYRHRVHLLSSQQQQQQQQYYQNAQIEQQNSQKSPYQEQQMQDEEGETGEQHENPNWREADFAQRFEIYRQVHALEFDSNVMIEVAQGVRDFYVIVFSEKHDKTFRLVLTPIQAENIFAKIDFQFHRLADIISFNDGCLGLALGKLPGYEETREYQEGQNAQEGVEQNIPIEEQSDFIKVEDVLRIYTLDKQSIEQQQTNGEGDAERMISENIDGQNNVVDNEIEYDMQSFEEEEGLNDKAAATSSKGVGSKKRQSGNNQNGGEISEEIPQEEVAAEEEVQDNYEYEYEAEEASGEISGDGTRVVIPAVVAADVPQQLVGIQQISVKESGQQLKQGNDNNHFANDDNEFQQSDGDNYFEADDKLLSEDFNLAEENSDFGENRRQMQLMKLQEQSQLQQKQLQQRSFGKQNQNTDSDAQGGFINADVMGVDVNAEEESSAVDTRVEGVGRGTTEDDRMSYSQNSLPIRNAEAGEIAAGTAGGEAIKKLSESEYNNSNSNEQEDEFDRENSSVQQQQQQFSSARENEFNTEYLESDLNSKPNNEQEVKAESETKEEKKDKKEKKEKKDKKDKKDKKNKKKRNSSSSSSSSNSSLRSSSSIESLESEKKGSENGEFRIAESGKNEDYESKSNSMIEDQVEF